MVTATQTITNDDYHAATGDSILAVGQEPVVTLVVSPVTKYYYFGSTRMLDFQSELEIE